ncbi:MAG: SpoIIIAH-like family protein [Clostridia bacterium]|nr:SpoIIIAH-like family protein [Clostridia bacterium]
MLKSLKRNQVVIYVIALMMVAAGYLNYTAGDKSIEANADPEVTYNENIADIGDATLVNSNEVDTENTDEYFSKSKLERDNMYSQMIETYQNIVNSSTVSEEQKAIATQEITKINNNKNAIMICENILGTKGLDKNVVFVNGDSVSVVVKVDGGLAENQVAQIQNVISREINVEIQNINITEK